MGAPEDLLAVAMAPIAPDPLVPEVFTPEKLNTVIDEATLCERVAVTVAALTGEDANARQTSDVPLCPLTRTTSAHVRPPPLTALTCVFAPER